MAGLYVAGTIVTSPAVVQKLTVMLPQVVTSYNRTSRQSVAFDCTDMVYTKIRSNITCCVVLQVAAGSLGEVKVCFPAIIEHIVALNSKAS